MKTDEQMTQMMLRLPLYFDWCQFKGETVVAQFNYEASQQAGKPMMDIYHCMTQALNQNVLRTVQFDKTKFKPSPLGDLPWKPALKL